MVVFVRETMIPSHIDTALITVPRIAVGQRCRSLDDPTWSMVLSDTDTAMDTPGALAREGLPAAIPRADDRLAAALERYADDAPARQPGVDLRATLALLRRHVENPELITGITDDDVIVIAYTMIDSAVRTWCQQSLLGPHADGSLRLWHEMAARCPGIWGAEPLVLLAVGHYLNGSTALATEAVTAALDAVPHHTLAMLLLNALSQGMSPAKFRQTLLSAR